MEKNIFQEEENINVQIRSRDFKTRDGYSFVVDSSMHSVFMYDNEGNNLGVFLPSEIIRMLKEKRGAL